MLVNTPVVLRWPERTRNQSPDQEKTDVSLENDESAQRPPELNREDDNVSNGEVDRRVHKPPDEACFV